MVDGTTDGENGSVTETTNEGETGASAGVPTTGNIETDPTFASVGDATLGTTGVTSMGNTTSDTEGLTECRDRQEAAEELVDAYQSCQAGDSCILQDMSELVDNSCLVAFRCSVALNSTADIEILREAAIALDEEYAMGCSDYCPDPLCIDPTDLAPVCDEPMEVCTLENDL